MNQPALDTILWGLMWGAIEVTPFLLAGVAAFWLALRADTNQKKFERAVGVLVAYSIAVALGYMAWIAASNYTFYGAILYGALIGAFHFILMAVVTGGVLWLTRQR